MIAMGGKGTLEPSPLMGEGRVGVAVAQRRGDGRVHAVRIAKHIVIPEADHAVAFRLDQARALRINGVVMLAAVALDHQPRAMACKVGNVVPQRHLATEPRLGKGFAQQPPHDLLGVGRIGPERSR